MIAKDIDQAWHDLEQRLDEIAGAGCRIPFWWRDDDAIEATPALHRLLTMSEETGVPVSLACIPLQVHPSLVAAVRANSKVTPLVHGLNHTNHAPSGEKKAEFGAHRPVDLMAGDARRGLDLMRQAFDGDILPIFVPPWNRLSPAMKPVLAGIGCAALSTFSGKSGTDEHKLQVIDTHVDLIDWRSGRSAVEERSLLRQISELVEERFKAFARRGQETMEPIGLLTHHLVHSEETWTILNRLLQRLPRTAAIQAVSIKKILNPATETQIA